jgi:hypothetical protein
MERLFKRQLGYPEVEAAIASDISDRLAKLFTKYNYLEPNDLLAMVVTGASVEVAMRGQTIQDNLELEMEREKEAYIKEYGLDKLAIS